MWKSEEKVGGGQWAVGSKNALRTADGFRIRDPEEKVGRGQWAVGSKSLAAGFTLHCIALVQRFVLRLLPTAHCPLRTVFLLLLTAHCILLTTSCRRDMQDQPKMKPFRSSTFFRDGLSTRPPIEGAVARGFLKTDTEFFTGKKPSRAGSNVPTGASQAPAGPQPGGTTAAAPLQGAAAYPDDVELFPIPVTKEIVSRGKERYEIFCTACHGLTGNGDGMIVRRGFRRAASFNDDRLRQAPVGHFFDAITNGWGAMPGYAAQIPVADRWAIITYVRALQLSQQSSQSKSAAPASATSSPFPSGGHE